MLIRFTTPDEVLRWPLKISFINNDTSVFTKENDLKALSLIEWINPRFQGYMEFVPGPIIDHYYVDYKFNIDDIALDNTGDTEKKIIRGRVAQDTINWLIVPDGEDIRGYVLPTSLFRDDPDLGFVVITDLKTINEYLSYVLSHELGHIFELPHENEKDKEWPSIEDGYTSDQILIMVMYVVEFRSDVLL